jgi:hypothetical protein
MEYEISDEHVLFDASTNPSLEEAWRPLRRQPPLPAKGKEQEAVPIPEEEQQLA